MALSVTTRAWQLASDLIAVQPPLPDTNCFSVCLFFRLALPQCVLHGVGVGQAGGLGDGQLGLQADDFLVGHTQVGELAFGLVAEVGEVVFHTVDFDFLCVCHGDFLNSSKLNLNVLSLLPSKASVVKSSGIVPASWPCTFLTRRPSCRWLCKPMQAQITFSAQVSARLCSSSQGESAFVTSGNHATGCATG